MSSDDTHSQQVVGALATLACGCAVFFKQQAASAKRRGALEALHERLSNATDSLTTGAGGQSMETSARLDGLRTSW